MRLTLGPRLVDRGKIEIGMEDSGNDGDGRAPNTTYYSRERR